MSKTYPSDLTDEQWALLEPHIPPCKHGGRKRVVDIRRVVNGILYRNKSGCQWRMLPKDFPPWGGGRRPPKAATSIVGRSRAPSWVGNVVSITPARSRAMVANAISSWTA